MQADFATLVASAKAGDREAREQLIQSLLAELRAFIRLRTGPALRLRESQSDLVQTVCRQALQDLNDYRGQDPGSFRSWLFETALHKLVDKQRYHAAQRRDAARHADEALVDCYASFCTPSRQAIAREEIARIEAGFDELTAEQREVLTLACILRLPRREIGDRMGRSEEAVRSLLARARARLAMIVDSERPGSST